MLVMSVLNSTGVSVDLDADLGQVVLHEIRHGDAKGIVAVGLQQDRDGLSACVLDDTVLVPIDETDAGKKFLRFLQVVVMVNHIGAVPHLVAGSGNGPVLVPLAEEDAWNHGVAIDGHRHGSPEHRVSEPFVFGWINERVADLLSRRRLLDRVEVEPEEVGVHIRPKVVEREVALLLVVLIPAVVLWLHIIESVNLSRPELEIGGIQVWH